MDIREEILKHVQWKRVTAAILADSDGIVAGVPSTIAEVQKLGLVLVSALSDGDRVVCGDEVIRFSGSPKQVVMAEEVLIGLLAKASGIATSARSFVDATGGKPRVVCGAWKKMPPSLKAMVRESVVVGGASFRMEPGPFVYLDKNYVELLGGVVKTLLAVSAIPDAAKVIQIKGRNGDLAAEACAAAESGADVIFIDTGKPADVRTVSERLGESGLRRKVKIAFGGGVSSADVPELAGLDIDILDIGRQIVDAPLLDMRMEIIETHL